MRLPAELRSMILDFLLDRDTCLSTDSELGAHEFKLCVQRTAQILRTCQMLYWEGYPILYDNNVIEIRVVGPGQYCDMLDAFVSLPQIVSYDQSAQLNLLDHAQSIIDTGRSAGGRAERLVQLYPALRMFRHFRLYVEYGTQDTVFIVCRMLRRLLQNKHVVFIPEPQGIKGLDAAACLESCRILKCSSFRFEDLYNLDDPQESIARVSADDFDGGEDISQSVTGRAHVRDTFLLWARFMAQFTHKLPHFDNMSFQIEYEQEVYELKQHMLDYDFEAYIERQKFLMERAVEWVHLWADTETNRILNRGIRLARR